MLLKRIPGRVYALLALGLFLQVSSALPQFSLHAQQQLMITPTTLPNGAIGAAYGQSLLASGGIPPYHYSITAGALPAGLNIGTSGALAGTGTIGGVPAGTPGTFPFTVQVTDSSTPALTGSANYSITISAADTSNDGELNGHYALLFSGFNDSNNTLTVVAASFTADGQGNITNGIEDADGVTGAQPTQTLTGSYTLGANNLGTMTLTTQSGTTFISFSAGGVQAGLVTKARFVRFDDVNGTTGHTGSGVILKQDTSAFTLSGISGSYAFGESGSNTTNGNPQSGVGFVNADGNGNFTPAGLVDFNNAGTIVPSAALTGTYATTPESASNGRFTGSLTTTGAAGTVSDILYVISASQVAFISIDPTQNTIYSGISQLQVPPTGGFALGSLNGNAVFSGQGKRSDGTSSVIIGAASFDGNGNFTVSFAQNKSGTFTTGDTASGTYTVASNGRSVLTFTTSSIGALSPVVLYLDATNQGFLGATDNAASEGILEQGGTGFNNATLSGPFFFGTINPTTIQNPNTVGIASFDGKGTVQSTANGTGSGGILLGDSMNSQSYSVASNGQLTFTDQGIANVVGYVASSCKIEVFSGLGSGTFPGLEPAECQGTQASGTLNVDLLNNGSSGVGTVTDSTGQIDCTTTGGELQSGSCSATYTVGMNVTFTETPGAGSIFTGWQDSCASAGTAPTCTITTTSFGTVLANFGNGPGTFTLNVTPGTGETGGGQVSSQVGAGGTINCTLNGSNATNTCSATVKSGSVFVLSEVANATSSFTGWSGACSSTGSCVVTMSQNQTVSPTFTATNFALTVMETGTGTGTVMSSPVGIACPTTCSANFTGGSQVTLTETPTNGSTFTGWGGACSGTGSCTVTMNAVEAVTANFSGNSGGSFTINVAAGVGATGSGTVIDNAGIINCVFNGTSTPTGTCSASFAAGTVEVLTATPRGSIFNGWSDACTGTTTCIVTMLQNETVVATFTAVPAFTGPYGVGDVFVSGGDGFVYVFKQDGTLLGSMNTGQSSDTGSAFDQFGNFYVTIFEGLTSDPPVGIVKFDQNAALAGPFGNYPAGAVGHPESVVFNMAGDLINGVAQDVINPTDPVYEFDSSGNLIATFNVVPENRGSDWVELLADQKTLLYTSEGVFVHSFNISTNTQNPDINANNPLPGTAAYAFRVLPNGNLLIADTASVVELSPTGTTVQTYTPNPGPSVLFALNLDPDGVSFWTADAVTGIVYKFNIASGAQLTTFTSPNGGAGGLALFGEKLVGTNNLTVTLAGSGTGTVTSSPSGISCPSSCLAPFPDNSNVILTATAAEGSTFAGFSSNCVPANPQTNPPTCTSPIGTADVTVTATFNSGSGLTLTVTKAGTGSGTVTSSPSGISCGSTCSASFASGTQVTLTASPADGSTFAGWSGGGCTGTGTCVVTLTAATTVTATFNTSTNNFALTVAEAGTGSGTVTSAPAGISCPTTCSANFASGTQVTLTAAASEGSTFAGWSGGGCSGTGTCVVTVTAATAVTASFNSSSPVTIGIGQGSSSTVTTTPGSSAVFGLVLTALPGTTGTVQLTCTSPVASITCNIVPSSVTLTGKAINVAIVVETFCKGSIPNFVPMPGAFGTGLGLLLATLCLCGMAWTYKRQPRWAVSFGLLVIFAVGMSACSNVAKSPSGSATPPGSYPLVVTATAPNGATSSVNLTLVVK